MMAQNGQWAGLVIVLGVVLIASLFFSGVLSTTQIEDQVDGFDNCRIILDGDVCAQYTECVYDSERDLSCVTGYEKVNVSKGETSIDEGQTGDKGASG